MLNPDSTVVVADAVEWIQAGPEILCLNTANEHLFTLDEVGSKIWHGLEQGRPLRAVIQTLRAQYGGALKTLQSDVIQFVGSLVEAELVSPRAPAQQRADPRQPRERAALEQPQSGDQPYAFPGLAARTGGQGVQTKRSRPARAATEQPVARQAPNLTRERGATLMQITSVGPAILGTDQDFISARAEFDRNHSVLLRRFIAPDVLQNLQNEVKMSGFEAAAYEGVGHDLCLKPGTAHQLLHLLINRRRLFGAVDRVCGCGRLGIFLGRIYRMLPNSGHHEHWHDDLVGTRRIALTINLSEDRFTGGIFQLRRRDSKQVIAKVANIGPGDGLLFRISDELEHRVTAVGGAVAKTACAGWFSAEPDFLISLRERQLAQRATGTRAAEVNHHTHPRRPRCEENSV